MKEKIAIIGSGIAGMTCSWHLRHDYDVYVFEKENYVGGHTNTVSVNENGSDVPIDTGFMVYNDRTYPLLNKLFAELEVQYQETDMSFGVNLVDQNRYYSCSGLNTFFAQRKQILNPSQWKLGLGISKFFKVANLFLEENKFPELSIAQFFKIYELDQSLARDFLYPMASAIWSTHHDGIEQFPALSLFRFMSNHGLLGIGTQFKWKTLKGGSRQYRDKILAKLDHPVEISNGVVSVVEQKDQVSIETAAGDLKSFDRVIVATHADQALALLAKPNPLQKKLLSHFKYTKNRAILHTDESVMPPQRRAWASWNYRVHTSEGGNPSASTHYWMNNLQTLPTHKNYFVSVDYEGDLDSDLVCWTKDYEHPCFNRMAMEAQPELPKLNQDSKILFCGSYFGYGFHEDAHAAAMKVVHQLKTEKNKRHEIMSV